jgi:transposase InsO family protein
LLRHCVTCRKVNGKPYKAPDPPPLPTIRLVDSHPFTVTGVDFAGALYVKTPTAQEKVYMCLFTSANTRAVHLEVVTDLMVPTFVAAFRRFASRKSLPKVMISDNASTYQSAAEELAQLLNSSELKSQLGSRGIERKFVPKRAPWYDGFWERLIGLTKLSLK